MTTQLWWILCLVLGSVKSKFTNPTIPLPLSTQCANNLDFELKSSHFSLEQSSLLGDNGGQIVLTFSNTKDLRCWVKRAKTGGLRFHMLQDWNMHHSRDTL